MSHGVGWFGSVVVIFMGILCLMMLLREIELRERREQRESVGSFKILIEGKETASIAYGASREEVQRAIDDVGICFVLPDVIRDDRILNDG